MSTTTTVSSDLRTERPPAYPYPCEGTIAYPQPRRVPHETSLFMSNSSRQANSTSGFTSSQERPAQLPLPDVSSVLDFGSPPSTHLPPRLGSGYVTVRDATQSQAQQNSMAAVGSQFVDAQGATDSRHANISNAYGPNAPNVQQVAEFNLPLNPEAALGLSYLANHENAYVTDSIANQIQTADLFVSDRNHNANPVLFQTTTTTTADITSPTTAETGRIVDFEPLVTGPDLLFPPPLAPEQWMWIQHVPTTMSQRFHNSL
ncbi:hypothetical protein LTR37_008140 [Vermiconidia calcicola]|uniref:Uncharacterized protein n=1 Tax=Vermiconidia calcicola TaxID=1690605 RepID=A0ACC3NBS6_9PEZI|nr:hypothetical protein LTR37_008140 [Vermiconidia calcicola]